MTDKAELALKSFNPQVMLGNISHVKTLISRIRQKEGGIGSEADEMALHRMIHDLDLLVDIVDGLKARYDELRGQFDTVAAALSTQQEQTMGLKQVYERMLQERSDRIKELEQELGLRPTPETPEEKQVDG